MGFIFRRSRGYRKPRRKEGRIEEFAVPCLQETEELIRRLKRVKRLPVNV